MPVAVIEKLLTAGKQLFAGGLERLLPGGAVLFFLQRRFRLRLGKGLNLIDLQRQPPPNFRDGSVAGGPGYPPRVRR